MPAYKVDDGEHRERARVLAEQRFRAVLEVRDGHQLTEIAVRYGVTRQTVAAWRDRYQSHGLEWLHGFSRRPHHSPRRVAADVEALICELRRTHRRWGARRISHELGRRGIHPVPAHATVHRVLAHNGLVVEQRQHRNRKYKRWAREAPMHLWQLDLVGGIYLADGRECRMLTGIDDHSRFVVVAAVLGRPSGNAVCSAFVEAMRRYGVPFEVLSDNGKQFTGRFTRPMPAEVLFERTCREYGITQRVTKRRSPTTTGKIERWHQTLRRELLDESGAFATPQDAQAAIDAWVRTYNFERPHQALDMATPASLFRPGNAAMADTAAAQPSTTPDQRITERRLEPLTERTEHADAVEIDMVVPGTGAVSLAGHQQVWLGKAFTGRHITIWADARDVHVTLDGHHVKTVTSRLSATHLQLLLMRGARSAEAPPTTDRALPRHGSLPPATVIEVERTIDRNGGTNLGGRPLFIDTALAGARVTIRLDGYLAHVIADGYLVKTLPTTVHHSDRAGLRGARITTTALPGPKPGPQSAQRRVPTDGVIMIARQRLRIGRTHAGKVVTIHLEDTHFRVLLEGNELSLHPRDPSIPLRHFKAPAPRTPGSVQDLPGTKR